MSHTMIAGTTRASMFALAYLSLLIIALPPVVESFLSPAKLSRPFSPDSGTILYSQPPRRQQPRRKLQKRRRRQSAGQQFKSDGPNGVKDTGVDDSFWQTAESKPLVGWASKEQGEDYWIDEEDLKRERERRKRKPPEPGQISEEKLWTEVLSPYRQNWIGVVSVIIVILATIITQFPELLNTPVIQIPDL